MLVMSFWVLLSPFGWFRSVPLLVAAIVLVFAVGKRRRISGRLAVWVLLTYLMDLIAWLFSKREITEEASRFDWGGFPSFYRAGFPVHWLDIPPSPMGGDIPPVGEWWVIAVNLAFWAGVAGVLVFVPRVREKIDNRLLRWFEARPMLGFACAFLVSQATLAMFLLWFD